METFQMWRIYLCLSLCVAAVFGNIEQECNSRRHDLGKRKCRATCYRAEDCARHEQCLCDGDCGKSCIDPNTRCHRTPSISHGNVTINPPSQRFAAVAMYQCHDGYTLVGSSARICQGDGTWKGSAPWCEQNHHLIDNNQYCGDPPQEPNAYYDEEGKRTDQGFKLGTNLRYRCNPGFTQQKASIDRAWCVRGPKWVGPNINCTTSGCTVPPDIADGYVEMMSQNTVGAKVRYTCREGFFLAGPSHRTCKQDGTWDKEEPSCQEVVCGPPPIVEHADHDGSKDQVSYLTGRQLTYVCRPGYFRKGSNRAICMGSTGQWMGPNMSCRARDCKAPGTIDNGKYDEGYRYTYPTRVTYYCNLGYELRGNHFRECMANGEWSGELPKCEPIHCDELGPPLHGTRIGSRTVLGSVIRFVCNNGYKVVGSDERVCESDRKWSGQTAECKEINCGPPGNLWNGYLDGHRTTVGAVYFFRCNLRTKFNGTRFSTQCLENGQWSSPLPMCLGQCQIPAINNGSVIDTMEGNYADDGTVIQLQCSHGRVLNDSRPVTCSNGSWTVIPKCVPAPCNSSPPQIEHGHRVFFSLAHGAKARYFCIAGYTLKTKAQFMTCKLGKWVHETPSCKEQFCPHPGKLANGNIRKIGSMGMFPFSDYISSIRHGERLLYQCDRNFRLSGPNGAACVNGKWSPIKHPKCQRSRHPVFNKLWRPFEENHSRPQYYR